MKRFLYFVFIGILLLSVSGCDAAKKTSQKNQTITLTYIEPAIHFAPIFIAMSNGYFNEEELTVKPVVLETGSVMVPQILAGTVDFALAGPEAPILSAVADKTNHPIILGEIVQKNVNALVRRGMDTNPFKLSDLLGKTIIGGKVATPGEIVFEHVLLKNNINFEKELNLVRSIPTSRAALAFRSGEGDFVLASEPNILYLEKDKIGKSVMKLSEYMDDYLYIGLYTAPNMVKKNPQTVQKFMRAVEKGLAYVKKESATTISSRIKSFFPEMQEQELTRIINQYKADGVWPRTTTIPEEHYKKMIQIMMDTKTLSTKQSVDFSEIIDNSFTKKVN